MPSRASVCTSTASACSRNSSTSVAVTLSGPAPFRAAPAPASRASAAPERRAASNHDTRRVNMALHQHEVSARSRNQYSVVGDSGKVVRALQVRRPASSPAADLARRWSDETRLGLVRRARRMNRALAQAFPHVYCELDFTSPLELTVATILSAQSTDKRVNLTTPALFARYRTALDYAQADRTELEEPHPSHWFLPQQGDVAHRPRAGAGRAVRRRGAGDHGRAGHAARSGAQNRQRRSWATPSISRESPSTPISGVWCGGGDGPPKRTRSRWSTRSAN